MLRKKKNRAIGTITESANLPSAAADAIGSALDEAAGDAFAAEHATATGQEASR